MIDVIIYIAIGFMLGTIVGMKIAGRILLKGLWPK